MADRVMADRTRFFPSIAAVKENLHYIYPKDEFRGLIFQEQARSNRFGSEFSLIVFNPSNGNGANTGLKRLISIILKRIRYSDELGWCDDDQIGIILPATGKDGAEKLAADIKRKTITNSAALMSMILSYPTL